MKTTSLAALLTGTVPLLPLTGPAQDVGDTPRITVAGSASVRVPPDEVNLTLKSGLEAGAPHVRHVDFPGSELRKLRYQP